MQEGWSFGRGECPTGIGRGATHVDHGSGVCGSATFNADATALAHWAASRIPCDRSVRNVFNKR